MRQKDAGPRRNVSSLGARTDYWRHPLGQGLLAALSPFDYVRFANRARRGSPTSLVQCCQNLFLTIAARQVPLSEAKGPSLRASKASV
jgi:hypothetical protein